MAAEPGHAQVFEPLWSMLFRKSDDCHGVDCYALYTRTRKRRAETGAAERVKLFCDARCRVASPVHYFC